MTAAAARQPGFGGTLATALFLVAAALLAVSELTLGFRAWTGEDARRIATAESPVSLSAVPVLTSQGHRERDLWTADPTARAWLVTFVYTRCLSVCQVLGSEFQQLQSAMHPASGVRLASISFDPARDTPVELDAYARRHRADAQRWVVVTPTDDAALQRLLREAGVVVIPDGLGGYAHNAAIHVVVPPGKLVRIFGMDQHHEALAFAEGLVR